MSAGDQASKDAVEGNVMSEVEQLKRDVAALRAQVLNLDKLNSASAEFGSGMINVDTSVFQRTLIGDMTIDPHAMAKPGKRQGYGVTMAGNAAIAGIGTTVLGTTGLGAVTADFDNGDLYRTFTSGAVSGNSGGVDYWGQSSGYIRMYGLPYFCAKVRTLEYVSYNIFAGLTESAPTATLPNHYCAFVIENGRWVGKYRNQGAMGFSADTGTSLPMVLSGEEYNLEFYYEYDAGSSKLTFIVNGIVETLDIPPTIAVALYPIVCVVTLEAAAKAIDIFGAYLEVSPPENTSYDPDVVQFAVRPSEADANDTYISNGATTTNYGTNALIAVGESNTSTNVLRSLIKFDLSSIPSGAKILSAFLLLVINVDNSSNDRDYYLRRVLRNWVETEATWVRYSASGNWQTAGGTGALDLDTVNAASYYLTSAEASGTVIQIYFDVDEFQKIIDGTYPNYGWMIKSDIEVNDAYNYHSSSATNPNLRPTLVVNYKL